MFLYTLLNADPVKKRGVFVALHLGIADRDLDLKINKEKFLNSKFNKNRLKLNPGNGDLIDALNENGVIGLKDAFFMEAHLGYGWRFRNFWVGVESFFGIEPRKIDINLTTSFDQRRDHALFEYTKRCAIFGGIGLNLGYYVTPSTALVGVVGFELGKQGDFSARKDPLNADDVKHGYLPDGGVRLGLEAKIDITERTSLKLGYHYSFLYMSPKSDVDQFIDKLRFYKYRIFVGAQYHFGKSF